jgi:hypothetical protein
MRNVEEINKIKLERTTYVSVTSQSSYLYILNTRKHQQALVSRAPILRNP